MFQKSTTKSLSKLRAVLASSRSAESLRDLPDRLAVIINRFDSIDVHDDFRNDIYAILSAATHAAEVLADDTYPADYVMAQLTNVMTILPRVINHLMNRPTTAGFSILNPDNNSIYPQVYTTEIEAAASLIALQKMGAARGCIVVPIHIHSMHAVQPLNRRLPPPPPPPLPSQGILAPESMPLGIKPLRPELWESRVHENETSPEDFLGPRSHHLEANVRSLEETIRVQTAKTEPASFPFEKSAIPTEVEAIIHRGSVPLVNSAAQSVSAPSPGTPPPPAQGPDGENNQRNEAAAPAGPAPPTPNSQMEKA